MPQLRDTSLDSSDVRLRTRKAEEQHPYRRIFGVETEYGVSVTNAEKNIDSSHAAMAMFAPVVSRSRSTNTYLTNGSRLYLDVGSHPEYATAEALTPTEAVEQDAAGESIMRKFALDAQSQIRETHGKNSTIHLFKNNVDSQGNSFGCHENYLLRRFVSLKTLHNQLIPFLVTRQIFAGAGRVREDGSFEISQRADFLDDTISSATTRSRPMINTRDEPHADSDIFRRLHVIVGDSNRSQTVTWMKLVTTHLVLCVIEDVARANEAHASGETIVNPFEGLELADPSSAIKIISSDLTGSARIETVGRGMLTAAQIQRAYFNAVSQFCKHHESSMDSVLPNYQRVLDLWEQAINSMESGNWKALTTWVDWAAKYSIIHATITRAQARTQTHNSGDVESAHTSASAYSPSLIMRLRQIDMDYHDVANGHVYETLAARSGMMKICSEQRIEHAVDYPPTGTRAHLRGDFVRQALHHNAPWSCDWTRISVGTPTSATCDLLDPFIDEPDASYAAVCAALTENCMHCSTSQDLFAI